MNEPAPNAAPSPSWAIDYEEGDLCDLGIYKFDHEPVSDGVWRLLNAAGGMIYRIRNRRLQCICPHEDVDQQAFERLLPALKQIEPLYESRALELVIRGDSAGIRISERGASLTMPVAELSREALQAAYDQLSRMPNRWE